MCAFVTLNKKITYLLTYLIRRLSRGCAWLKARRRGIVDEAAGVFVDLRTGARQPLSGAVEAGLVMAEYDYNGTAAQQPADATNANGRTDTQTYAVNSVVDQVSRLHGSFRPGLYLENVVSGGCNGRGGV